MKTIYFEEKKKLIVATAYVHGQNPPACAVEQPKVAKLLQERYLVSVLSTPATWVR